MKRGFFSKATAILLAVCLSISYLPARTVHAEGATVISQSVTWADGSTIGPLVIEGSNNANNPLIITVGGKVTVAGTISSTGFVKIVEESGATAVLLAKADSDGQAAECMLENGQGSHLEIDNVDICGSESGEYCRSFNAGVKSEESVILNELEINCFRTGIEGGTRHTLSFCSVNNCEYGIKGAGLADIRYCSFRSNGCAVNVDSCSMNYTTIRDNDIGVSVSNRIDISEDIYIANNNTDVDLKEGTVTVGVNSFSMTSDSRICVTNAVLQVGQTVILAEDTSGYSVPDDRLARIVEYRCTPAQEAAGLMVGTPRISGKYVVADVTQPSSYDVTISGGGYTDDIIIPVYEGESVGQAASKMGLWNFWICVKRGDEYFYSSKIIDANGNEVSLWGLYPTAPMTIYRQWAPANALKIYVEQPVCGTVFTYDYNTYTQTNGPVGTVPDGAHYYIYDMRWGGWDGPLSGTINGDETYALRVGIIFDETINFSEATIVDINDGMCLLNRGDCSDESLMTEGWIPAVHDWSEWEVVTPATETAEGLERRVCSGCGKVEERAVPVLSYEPVRVHAASLTLTGEIGVNFYLDIPKVDVPDAVVHIEFRGNTTDFVVADMAAEPVTTRDLDENTDRYKFTGYAAAKEMRDLFTVWITDKEGNPIQLENYSGSKAYSEGYTYSVARYFEIVRNDPQYAYIVDLVDAMDNYGKYAQLFFGYNAEDLSVKDVSEVTLDVLKPYKNKRTGTLPAGLTYLSSSLTLEAETKYSHAFKLEAGHEITEYKFTVNGDEVTPVKSGDTYKVIVDNIAAKRLGEFTETSVSLAGSDTVLYSIEYCALSYARAALRTDAQAADVCRALYNYYIKADAFFRQYGNDN